MRVCGVCGGGEGSQLMCMDSSDQLKHRDEMIVLIVLLERRVDGFAHVALDATLQILIVVDGHGHHLLHARGQ